MWEKGALVRTWLKEKPYYLRENQLECTKGSDGIYGHHAAARDQRAREGLDVFDFELTADGSP